MGNRAAENESARLNAGDIIEARTEKRPDEFIHRCAKGMHVGQERGDVAEHDTGPGIVQNRADIALDVETVTQVHDGRTLSGKGVQSNRLETDSSRAVRAIASPIRVAMPMTRMLRDTRTASVGWIESVMTSSFSLDEVMRATAPPERTPWVI